MRRFGMIGKLKPESVEKYVDLHANTWPTVLASITDCNIRNYSIFLRKMPDGEHYLFSYFEYVGEDFDADMQRMAANPEIQRWWAECKPCFERSEDLPPDEVWAPMDQIFYRE